MVVKAPLKTPEPISLTARAARLRRLPDAVTK
jgi:hypothetical protein